MGDKMRTFVDELRKNEPLKRIISANLGVQASLEVIRMLEDPDINEDVLAVMEGIKIRLIEARERRKSYKPDYNNMQRTVMGFKKICEKAGIKLEWTPQDIGEVQEEIKTRVSRNDGAPLSKPAPSESRYFFERVLGKSVQESSVFRPFIEGGTKTIEIGCPGFRDFPDTISQGEIVVFNFDDGKRYIKTRALRVATYGSLEELFTSERNNLKKWATGHNERDVIKRLRRMFMERRIKEHGLLLFEFETVD